MNSMFDRELEGRLLRYVRIDTQSDEKSTTSPSTHKQYDLLRLLAEELTSIGAADVQLRSPTGTPLLQVRLQLDRVASWGLRPMQVIDAMQVAYEGRVVGRSYQDERVIDVAVLLDPEHRRRPDDVAELPLRTPDGVIVPLSGAEFRLLTVFVEHPNRVLDRNQLMDLTVGRDGTPIDRSIDVQVSRLRVQLRDDAREPRIIKTVRSEGYVLAATVERLNR